MVDGGQNGFHQVFCAQAQAGSIDAGVAAHIFTVQHIFIDQKLHMVFGIVHQAQHTDRAGRRQARQYRIILSADTASEARQLLSQKRR